VLFRSEMSALSALIEFYAVNINAFTGEFAGKRNRVSGDLSFERSARCALRTYAGCDLGIFALE
jgi:hypothetical protein